MYVYKEGWLYIIYKKNLVDNNIKKKVLKKKIKVGYKIIRLYNKKKKKHVHKIKR